MELSHFVSCYFTCVQPRRRSLRKNGVAARHSLLLLVVIKALSAMIISHIAGQLTAVIIRESFNELFLLIRITFDLRYIAVVFLQDSIN